MTASGADSNIIQFPAVVVTAEADPDTHGWHVRGRRNGRVVYHRNSYGLRSVAKQEAANLARRKLWWLE